MLLDRGFLRAIISIYADILIDCMGITMRSLIKITKALSDPNRVRILKLLQQRPLCVCEIQAVIPLAQSTISTHLKILSNADLIDFSKEGLWVVYELLELKNNQLKQLVENLLAYLDKDEEIILLLKKLKTIDRYKACQKES